MGIFGIDFRRSFISRNMAFVILVGLISIFLGIIMEPLKSAIGIYQSNVMDLSYEAKKHLIGNSLNKATLWHFGNYIYPILVPLVSCIPFAVTYARDRKTGVNKYIIIRSSYKKYVRSRMINTFLSGFLAVFITYTISFILIIFMDSGDSYRSIFYNNTFLSDLNKNNLNTYLLIYTIISSLTGGVYAIIGLTISAIVDNLLVATISPFMFYYIGTYIFSGTKSMALFSPSLVNQFYMYEGIDYKFIFLQLSFLFTISILLFLLKTYWSDNFE